MIQYKKDTIFLIQEDGKNKIIIMNTKESNFNLKNDLNNIQDHCSKCKETILAILN
jgi:hypothetical protein